MYEVEINFVNSFIEKLPKPKKNVKREDFETISINLWAANKIIESFCTRNRDVPYDDFFADDGVTILKQFINDMNYNYIEFIENEKSKMFRLARNIGEEILIKLLKERNKHNEQT